MQKFLRVVVCLFLVSTLVTCVSCEKKKEAPSAPTEEAAPPGEAAH
jgi:hypothetical protein